MIYSSIEFFITNLLKQAAGTGYEGFILIQGMSYSVKSRKLQTLINHKYRGCDALIRLLQDLDEVNTFRDRLLHWTKLPDEDAGHVALKDIGRNPANLMQTQIEVTAQQLRDLSKWMFDAHSCLFVVSIGGFHKTEKRDGLEKWMLSAAPPLPKGHQPIRRKPGKKPGE